MGGRENQAMSSDHAPDIKLTTPKALGDNFAAGAPR